MSIAVHKGQPSGSAIMPDYRRKRNRRIMARKSRRINRRTS